MSNIVLSIYKQDVNRICGYIYSDDNLTSVQAEVAIREFANNYYGDLDIFNLIEISNNKYMFDIFYLNDEFKDKNEDIKISIYDDATNRVCGYAYSDNEIDRVSFLEKIKLILSYFGYDIGGVNFTTINDKKYMFNTNTKNYLYDNSIKHLVKER